MKKLKTQRGITLIALIITIIVMLILVAVTVTVALNGGLFKTAKEATNQTELEKEKELLLEVVMGAIGKDGKVDFQKLAANDMFVQNGDLQIDENGKLSLTIAESGRTYKITSRGTIELVGNEGGGEAPPTGGGEPEEPSDPGSGGGPIEEAGLYSLDGTFTSWAELTTGDNPIIPLSEDGKTMTSGSYESGEILKGKIVISNDITTIGDFVFHGFDGLTEAIIPNSVTSIGSHAFNYCTSLTSVTIGNSVTSIGYCAFNSCSLTTLTIPDSVTSIDEGAFYGCDDLTTVTIGDGLESIADNSFYFCNSLTQFSVSQNNTTYSSDNGVLYNKNKTTILIYPAGKTESEFAIPNGVTTIGNHAFSECYNLSSITIPDGVTSIGNGAFCGCSSLREVNIPNSVTSIGDSAFSMCMGLTSVTIGNSVTSIGEYAFSSCDGLTEVTIPNSVTNIGNQTFDWCRCLTRINVSENNSNYSSDNGVLYDKNKTTIICYPAAKTESSFIIPASVTTIGDGAFKLCEGLTEVTIPSSVATIGEKAFENCRSLTLVTIPDSVTSIGVHAFLGCENLTATILGSDVEIGTYAFDFVPKVYYNGTVPSDKWGAVEVLPIPSGT